MTSLKGAEDFWAKVCFDPEYQPEGPFKTYRKLITDRFLKVLKNLNPVAAGILNEEEWKALLWDFLKKSPPISPILRELPLEFSNYLKNHDFPYREKYPYLPELIDYEYREVQVRYAPGPGAPPTKGKIKLNPAHVLAEYSWPVHFIGKEFSDPKGHPQGSYHLLLWRAPKDLEVHFMEVNPLTATLVCQLAEAEAEPKILLQRVARQQNLEATEGYFQEGHALLKDLQDKGVVMA